MNIWSTFGIKTMNSKVLRKLPFRAQVIVDEQQLKAIQFMATP